MPEYPRSPMKKVGTVVSMKVTDDLLEMDNDVWVRWVNYVGSDVVNGFKTNESDEIDVGGTLNVGSIEGPEDGGPITFSDMPISSGETLGDEESFMFKMDGNHVFTYGALADGAGGVLREFMKFNCAIFEHRTDGGAADYNPSVHTSDYGITVDNSAAARAVTISTEDVQSGSADNPRYFQITDEQGAASAYNITITLENGGTISGAASAVIKANYNSVTLYSTGTNAFII